MIKISSNIVLQSHRERVIDYTKSSKREREREKKTRKKTYAVLLELVLELT